VTLRDDDPVAWLVAHEEIRQLASRYAVALDARDLGTLVALFVDDVQVGRSSTGHDALRANFDAQLQPLGVTVLQVTNHVIDVLDADHATGIVSCHAQIDVDRPATRKVQAIQYHDDYERRSGRWLFVRRRHRLFFDGDTLGDLPTAFPTWGAFTTG